MTILANSVDMRLKNAADGIDYTFMPPKFYAPEKIRYESCLALTATMAEHLAT
jgi:hypothetical protein